MNTQPTIATTAETQSLEIGQVIQGENCKLVVTTIKVKSNEVESKEIELKFAIAKTILQWWGVLPKKGESIQNLRGRV